MQKDHALPLQLKLPYTFRYYTFKYVDLCYRSQYWYINLYLGNVCIDGCIDHKDAARSG